MSMLRSGTWYLVPAIVTVAREVLNMGKLERRLPRIWGIYGIPYIIEISPSTAPLLDFYGSSRGRPVEETIGIACCTLRDTAQGAQLECSSNFSVHVDPPNLQRANPSVTRRPLLLQAPPPPPNAPRPQMHQKARPERGGPTRNCMTTSYFSREHERRRRSVRRHGSRRSRRRKGGEQS
jgi:hypothetical protein